MEQCICVHVEQKLATPHIRDRYLQLKKQNKMSYGAIEINRTRQYANKARAIAIFVNGKKVGSIKDGETELFNLEEQRNEVFAKIDWCKTKPLEISCKENETVKLELGSSLSGAKMLLAIYYIIFKTSEYLYLKKSR